MTDELLRDNVERLLKDRREAPSPEFLKRLAGRMRPQGHGDRSGLVGLIVMAATVLVGFVVWLLKDQDVAMFPAQEAPLPPRVIVRWGDMRFRAPEDHWFIGFTADGRVLAKSAPSLW
ncbi:MAG: hypothetical protein HYY16_00925 [Planctomycetes bacterium]|nr:hypothetical protein [Planctomycetota bacterium]